MNNLKVTMSNLNKTGFLCTTLIRCRSTVTRGLRGHRIIKGGSMNGIGLNLGLLRRVRRLNLRQRVRHQRQLVTGSRFKIRHRNTNGAGTLPLPPQGLIKGTIRTIYQRTRPL